MYFTTKEALAAFAIRHMLQRRLPPRVPEGHVAKKLRAAAACFVSVYVDGMLRGCVGSHEAFEPLYQNIIRNAIDATTLDFRFSPIQKHELANLSVEVSVLTPLKKIKPKSIKSLIAFLEKERPGILIEHGERRALFLPQVWKTLPSPHDFLSHLSLKAGLSPSAWREAETTYWIFSVRKDM